MPLLRRALAEALGTFGFVFLVCAAIVMENFPSARYGPPGIAAIGGFALAAMVSATMAISGGQLNPAITVALALTRRLGGADAATYVAAQLVGAAAAVAALMAVVPAGVGGIVLWGAPQLSSRLGFVDGILIEALLTFVLVLTWLGTVARREGQVGGLAVGLAGTALTMIGTPLTGAAMNPARALGPALLGGNPANLMVWVVGPLVGALVAAGAWRLIEIGDQ